MQITPVGLTNINKTNTKKSISGSSNTGLNNRGSSCGTSKNFNQTSFTGVLGMEAITSKYTDIKSKVKGWGKKKKIREIDKQETAEIKGYARGMQELLDFHEKQAQKAEEALATAIRNNEGAEKLKDLEIEVEQARKTNKIQSDLILTKKNKGWDKISGYFGEKEVLSSGFIQAVGLEKAGDKNASELIPNGILFFGPTGNGKSTFARAFAEQSQSQLIEIDPLDSKNFEENLLQAAQKAKKTFEETNTRTIVLIDEFETFGMKKELGGNPQRIAALKAFMEGCSDKYKTTLFLTTNNPQDIDPILLADSRTPIRVFLDPPNKENASAIFKHYINNKTTKNIDTDKLADEILKTPSEGAYSNSRIKTIVESCYKTVAEVREMTEDDLLQYIEKTGKPDILKEHLEKYKLDKQAIYTIVDDISHIL